MTHPLMGMTKRFRHYGKYGKTKHRIFRNKVARIARAVTTKGAEHKYSLQLSSLTNAQCFGDKVNVNVVNGSPMCLIAEGTDYNQRVGHEIKCSSLMIRGFAWKDGTNTPAAPLVFRMLVFRSLGEDFGTPPALADILEDVSSGNAIVTSPHNLQYVGQGKTYKVLADKTFTLDEWNRQSKAFHYRIPLHGGIVRYVGNAATQSSLGVGAYYVFWVTNELSTDGTAESHLNWKCRLNYTDV